MEWQLEQYRKEMQAELGNILSWWAAYGKDDTYGGFTGSVDNNNEANATAAKGSVLNSRILWSFACAYNTTGEQLYLQMAERAWRYLVQYLTDREYGGVFWTVDYTGQPLDMKKQIYSQSFAIYGLSEYYLATRNEAARQQAIELYRLVVKYSYDAVNGGFIEALARDWSETDDLRLSGKDANEKKSMNTHLHVLEGFANLYRIWPDPALCVHIHDLVRLFTTYIIDATTHHLLLFFDNEWQVRSEMISYGHDIEAAWLIQEAAAVIRDEALLQEIRPLSLQLANAASCGLDADGGLWYECAEGKLVKEKHWWPQAEAMVGFYNAWQLSGQEQYLRASLASWSFIRKYLRDELKGEWYWGVTDTYAVMSGQEKAGLWKCPYHNSRACIEILKRIG